MPAEPVAVLLLHRAGDENGDVVGNQPLLLHNLCAVHRRDDAALLVAAAPAADLRIGLVTLVGIEFPVFPVADAHGVDMGVIGDDLFTVTHPAQNVSLAVDLHLVKAHLFHLGGNTADDALFFAALAGNGDQVPQESGHIGLVAFGGGFDCIKIHFTTS
ncbi:hypothetical protein SDC9_121503 [bioreactor metagenome]|uniref:Uncharacterized protein n=1 Tax=bioreactor metagenome TaxID=1076179 RepID=A0A645CC62_9ZZZZ